MSKINQIEKALQEIDATKFHKLLDAYLTKKISAPHSNGTKLGEDKPIKGTPDSYIVLEDGKYIFIEYTAQKTNIVEKFLKDLEKCFDEEKTGIKVVQINKIVLACNSDLNPQEIKQFIDYCSSKNITCEFIGNSYLANDLFSNYPNIAKEFLDISIDTGQILDCVEFIDAYEKNKFSTSLNTTLQFRDVEIQNLRESLANNQITFITGAAGVGKTKLAIDISSLYAKENGFIFKAILNRGANIFDDLKVYFNSQSEQYLIFIDDVNRIHLSLEYLFEYYGEKINQGTIKIIATIRDYAKEKLFDKLPKSISYYELELKPLSDDSIKKIVEKEYSITNHLYLERIADIAQGNPRLALMAASIVKKQNRLDAIYDVTTLYDEYFSSIKKDIEIFEKNDLLLLSVAIISFFRIIDRENTQQIDMIEKAFDISIDAIWKNIEELHRLEVVDMYENNVVKVSDQILSTYLFYKTVFVDKKINIGIFLKHFFPSFKGKFVDALNPLLSSFDTNLILEVLREPVNNLWGESLSNKQHIYEVINTFWFLKQTDILIYFSEAIEQLDNVEIDAEPLDIWKQINTNQTDEILNKLSLFRHDSLENMKISIELIITYLTKVPSKIYEVIIVLTKNFGIKYDSYRYNYSKEKILIDTLWNFTEHGKNQLLTRLFIRVCSEFLKTEFEENKMKGHNFIISRYKPFETENLQELRNDIFEKLDILFSSGNFLGDLENLIQKYPSGISYSADVSNVEKWDVQNILNLIEKYFDSSIYRHCQIVQNLLKSFDGHKLVYDTSIKETFKHQAYELKKLLFLNDVDISLEQPRDKEEKTDWDKIRQIKHDRLADFVKDYTLSDWLQLFDSCKLFFAEQGRDAYNLKSSLNELFHIIAHKNETLYIDILEKYLELGDPFLLNLNMSDLIKIVGKEKAFEFIKKYSFQAQETWLFNLFIAIDESKITSKEAESLLELYKTSSYRSMPSHLDYLIKYCTVDENIFLEIMTILVNRAENEDNRFVDTFSIIFNPFTDIFKLLDQYIYSDIVLFKKAYLFCLNCENHFDYDMMAFNKLINFDINFVDNYIVYILNSHDKSISSHDIHNDFSLIWKRDDYQKIFLRIIEVIYSLKTKQLVWRKGELLKVFFINRENQGEIENRADSLIKKYIDLYFSDNKKIIFIFELISEFSEERKIALISYFIARNDSFELFKQLSLEPMMQSWNGSRIPSLQKEIDFFTSLLSLMTTAPLLRHKQKIQQSIDFLKQDIQRERKSDFMRDDY
ncbi:hypothetical protein Sdiek1_0375 [Sulfurospirillum diekertiae]|uniref:Uncharacterized protein n=1 Tax=Sulfurospirillum diekertiae TaxID=1854492 RepID=A0A1Y0HHH2_9BACT|nr:hypothetical protein [Sulfurospirillum diekertiae]ARU47557.1 hypothetical protein Sdiek1_0375 [Sulfurospirillum diekertiae]